MSVFNCIRPNAAYKKRFISTANGICLWSYSKHRMTICIVVFMPKHNRIIVAYNYNLKLSFLGFCHRNSYKRPQSNAYIHKAQTLPVSTWTLSQMHLDKAVKSMSILHQPTSWTTVMTIGSGNPSLNSLNLRRDIVCGRGFCKARFRSSIAIFVYSFKPRLYVTKSLMILNFNHIHPTKSLALTLLHYRNMLIYFLHA